MPSPKEAMYEVGSAIEFVYRCNGVASTADPSVDILDETMTVVSTLTVGSGLTQIGSTKLFKGSFIPDAEGVWAIHGTDVHGGDSIKDFAVGLQGVQSMAAKITAIDANATLILADTTAMKIALVAIENKVDLSIATIAVVDGKADSIQTGVNTLDGKINTVQTGVDDANTKLDSIDPTAGGAHFG